MKIPRWGKILLGLVALLAVAGLALPYVLDVDRYRPMLISAIEKETGRKASLGAIRARFIPSVGFTIEKFELGSPKGFGEHALVSVEAVRGSLAWGPLLRREFQLSSIELVRPKVQLIEDETGKTNYEFPAAPAPAAKAAPSAMQFKLADIDSIEITGAEVLVAQVAGRNRRLIPGIRATNLNADLNDIALDAARIKQWEAESSLGGVVIELPGLQPIEVKSGEFTLSNGAVKADFRASAGRAADVRGKLQVADVENSIARFELSMPLLDLDQLASVTTKTTPAAAPGSAPRRSEKIAEGAVTADRVRFSPYEGTGARVEVRVFTDRLEAWPMAISAYDGTIGVSARVDRRQSPERFSANIEVRNLNVGKLTAASGAQKQVTGAGEATLQVFGALGNDVPGSLTGNGAFAVKDGTLPGLQMGGFMSQLVKLQKLVTFGAGSAEQFSKTIPFRSITGDLRPGGGRISSHRIHLDSSVGTVELRGSFGFNQTLDYNGNAEMMGGQTSGGGGGNNPLGAITGILGTVTKQTIGRVQLGFHVGGTFDNPKVTPVGMPRISIGSGSSTQGQTGSTPQPQKKKSIFDIFKKPPS